MLGSYRVVMTDDAARDLDELFAHLHLTGAPGAADLALDQFQETFAVLSGFPERGSYPKGLWALGVREYREIPVHLYRVVYRILENDVYVVVISDSRRDLQLPLERRLLET